MRNWTLIGASALSLVLYQIVIMLLAGGLREIGLFIPIIAVVGGSTGAVIGALSLGLSRLARRSTSSPKAFAVTTAFTAVLLGMVMYACDAGHSPNANSLPFIWMVTFYVTSIAPLAILRILPEFLLSLVGSALLGAVTGALASYATNKVHGNPAA